MIKVIIRVPNWVGDAVMALPAIDNAREMTGADYLSVMARSATAPLFQNHPDPDRVYVINDKKSQLSGPKKAAALIKDEAFDIGLLFTPSFSSALIFKLAGVRGRIGFTGDKRSLLLTRRISPPVEVMHRARQYLYLMEKLTGTKARLSEPHVNLALEDISGGEEILKKYGLSYDSRFIAIAPQAIARSRRWGAENYGKLAAEMATRFNCTVLLIGSDNDFEAGEIVKALGGAQVINLCGQTSLLQAAAILSFTRLFVGNDSGLAHLAAAAGCPVTVLSGPDNPAETSPLTKQKKIIIKDIDCISCVKNDCPLKGEDFMRCMKLIDVDEVLNAAAAIIRK